MPEIELDELIDALQGIKKRKNDDAVTQALNRKFSMADLREAWENATPEERSEFRELFGGTPVEVAKENQQPTEEKPKPKAKPKPKPEPVEKPTRAGRKSGQAYDWDVDEGGQVIPLNVARVYSGPDEDDEVEIPDPPEAEESEDDEDAA